MTTKLAFNLREAAQATGVSQLTLKRAITSGALKAKKSSRDAEGEPAGNFVILAGALERWVEGLADA